MDGNDQGADETHAMTIRFPPGVYERLRTAAFEGRVSMAALVNEGTVALLDQLEAEKAATPPEPSPAERLAQGITAAEEAYARDKQSASNRARRGSRAS